MPLEIRELIIKATVGGEGSGKSTTPSSSSAPQSSSDPNQQIMLIVEKVLEILKDKHER